MHPVASIFSAPYNRGCFLAGSHLFFALFLLLFETLSLALDFVEVVWCEGGFVVFRFGLLPFAWSNVSTLLRQFDSFPCRLLGSSLISFAVLDGTLVLGGSSFKVCCCRLAGFAQGFVTSVWTLLVLVMA
jgi:hypothetical protein